jgi:hypothetical protein
VKQSCDKEGLRVDHLRALEVQVGFTIATKAKKGAAWANRRTEILVLLDAFRVARDIEASEVAIFTAGRGEGAFIYWSSGHPEIFNSSVISLAANS